MAEKYLSQIYYNPESPASFGGIDSIYRVVKDEGKHQISRNKIRLWLQKQDTYTLHKSVRYRFKRNRVIVGAIDEQWEADLVIMDSISKYNNGFKYILTVIDVLSKYAWAEPIRTKTGENLVKAFEKILKKGRKPETFHSDKGTEFMNQKFQAFLKKHNIRFFTTQNETKASIVERFNRTLKRKMWKYFTAKNTLKYVDILQKLVKSYNHSRHRSIGMRPVDVNEDNESIVWQKLYGEESDKSVRFKFNIGDQVRISKARRTFKKGYLPNWTEEVFTITKRVLRRPPVYKIADFDDEELKGTFYEQELQRVNKSDSDFYRVEEVLRSRMRNKRKEYFVKWLGYPDKFNSWVPAESVKDIKSMY
ncbi:uncharacterized transposon-derived [Paramuricea clavata]|uniref:Uncharacterized transposon-derived n=2 Tax=Paramuricea clavata TaxID=317549 RepID=A0A6S7JQ88_PARCT|nr:uncharacterized transposon-derived [Paramuricea clavata]